MTRRLIALPIGAVIVLAAGVALVPTFAPTFAIDAPEPGPTIAIRGESVSIDGEAVPIDSLADRLRVIAPGARVTIAADPHVAASVVARVADAARVAGCADVSLVVLPP